MSYKSTGQPNWNGGMLADPATIGTGSLESGARSLRAVLRSAPLDREQRRRRQERLDDLEAELLKRRQRPASPDHEYVFDLKLLATARVKAPSEPIARAMIANYAAELDISMVTPDGVTFSTATMTGDMSLVEVDDEPT